MLHDHESFGFRRGCVACAQTEVDLELSRRAALEPVVEVEVLDPFLPAELWDTAVDPAY